MIQKFNIVLLISLFSFLVGCKTAKEQVVQETGKEVISVKTTPQILMVNFLMNSKNSVKIVNSIKNPGRLRGEIGEIGEPRDGDLIISFLNESNMVCSKIIIENPLNKIVEYSESDDFSTLKTETISLDSAEFFIRVQLEECFKQLRIEKLDSEKIKLLGFYQISELF
jgi:hypothetical protein